MFRFLSNIAHFVWFSCRIFRPSLKYSVFCSFCTGKVVSSDRGWMKFYLLIERQDCHWEALHLRFAARLPIFICTQMLEWGSHKLVLLWHFRKVPIADMIDKRWEGSVGGSNCERHFFAEFAIHWWVEGVRWTPLVRWWFKIVRYTVLNKEKWEKLYYMCFVYLFNI